MKKAFSGFVCLLALSLSLSAADQTGPTQYKLLATSRTSTLEKELNDAAAQGYRLEGTMGGEIRINSVYGPLKLSTMGGNITARVVGTSNEPRNIEMSSKGGTIRLTVPKDFPMDVRVTLAYTRNSRQDFRIDAQACERFP